MKKYTLLITMLILSFSLFSSTAFAKDSLIGYWANNKIKLHLKTKHKYSYEVKILGIRKTFTGTWLSKDNILTLTYRILGKHQKTAKYSFDKGDLILKQKGKTSRLKRQK